MPSTDSPRSRPTAAQLRAKVSELEAANAELRSQLAQQTTQAPPPVAAPRKPRRWRTAVSILLIVLGSVLMPVATVGGWSRLLLSDTDSFVATYAPLAKDPKVQAYITDQVVVAIDQRLDINALVGQVVTSLSNNLNSPTARTALSLLQQPAADGVRSIIRTATQQVVSSDAFAQAWEQALRTSHTQAIAALSGDPNAMLTINDQGLGLRLAPLIAQVKAALVQQGFGLASQIPEIDRTVVLVQADSMPTVQLAYQLAMIGGAWLGPFAVALLVAGVLVSNRKHTATIGAAVGLAIGTITLLAALRAAGIFAELKVPSSVIPRDVLDLLYNTATSTVSDLARASLLLAVVIGCAAWLAGPYRPAVALRNGYRDLRASMRAWGDARHLSTGAVGEWIYTYRAPLQIAVALLAAGFLALNRPLFTSTVVGTAVVGVVVLLILSLVERPPVATESTDPTPASEPTVPIPVIEPTVPIPVDKEID